MNSWDRYWFGPVCAVRPYLFSRLLLLIVGCDAIALMTERGSRYGLDGFSVPHFQWLDAIHPTPPNATWYVGVLMLVSFLALTLVFLGPNRGLQIALTLLYTYGWSMSRHDSYLHHYMLSLILTAMIFFPSITARQLLFGLQDPPDLAPPESEPLTNTKGRGETDNKKNWMGQAWLYVVFIVVLFEIYRGIPTLAGDWVAFFAVSVIVAAATLYLVRSCDFPNSPLTSAWGYRLLGATVGVIYVYTSLAKADAEWCGGHTLQKVGNTTAVLQPIAQIFTSLGGTRDLFWSALATFVIPLELCIAASYFIAVRQDEPARKKTRWWCCFAWLLAIGLHLNNEMMNLSIQWFGYYMMFVASMFFLPARLLMAAAMVFALPAVWLEDKLTLTSENRKPSERMLVRFALAILAAAMLVVVASFAGVPGAALMMPVIATTVGIIGLVSAARNKGSLRFIISTILAAGVMLLAIAQSDMRFDYYDIKGRMLQNLAIERANEGSTTSMLEPRSLEVREAFETALKYADPSDTKTADTLCNLGITLRKLGELTDARRSFQRAIDVQPGHFLAHYSLANYYLTVENFQKAVIHYKQATLIKSDFSDAFVNWGVALQRSGKPAKAIELYQKALEIEPNAEDIKQMIATAQEESKKGNQ